MLGAFNQVYKAFQGFLSQDFWYTVFVPIALFGAIHVLIAAAFGWRLDLNDLFSDTGSHAKALLVAIAGLAVAGYVLQSFLPLMRGWLDGSLLPTFLHYWLRQGRLPAIARARNKIATASNLLGQVAWRNDRWRDDAGPIRAARREGNQLAGAQDQLAIDRAEAAIVAFERRWNAGKLSRLADLDGAQTELCEALRANNADLAPTAPMADLQRSWRLRSLHIRFEDALSGLLREVEYHYNVELGGYRMRASIQATRATELGDARYATERYSSDAYGVSFDFLWPRLLLVLRTNLKDDPILPAIDTARGRIDFAIICLALACTVPLVWLPVLFAYGGPGWLVPVIGGATPLTLSLFYHMAVEGQFAFSDVMNTAIDRHRFLVLTALRQPIPVSRLEERQLWQNIGRAEVDPKNNTLLYVAEEKPAKGTTT